MALTKQEIEEFNAYLAACTDRQVQGVWEKEHQAARFEERDLTQAEARRRGITLTSVGSVSGHREPPLNGPRRWAVGDKVVITNATLAHMHWHSRQTVYAGYPNRDFLDKAQVCVGIVGEVTHVFPPGYEVTAKFGDQSFHMKDNWIEYA